MFDFKQFIPAIPKPLEAIAAVRAWLVANGVWWGARTAAHVVVLGGVMVMLGTVTGQHKEGE